MERKLILGILIAASILAACQKDNPVQIENSSVQESAGSFKEVAIADLGGETAAEISAYDAISKRLFVVNNEGGVKVDILDLSKFPVVNKFQTLNYSTISAGINSVAVSNGVLAVALDGLNKQENGRVVLVNAATLAEIKQVIVGALPDMVTYSPDGKYILTANEGEPNTEYTNDPPGSISIIDVKNNCSVKTLDFARFESSKASLLSACFRIFGLNASFAKDIEPEYFTVSDDSRKAWVTLQENNGVAEVDLLTSSIVRIIPLGTKNINRPENAFDVSDKDGKTELNTWPVKSFYLPDAISYFSDNGKEYLALANEGDTRDYDAFKEEVRVKDMILDATRFPNAAFLQLEANLGRLIVTNTRGDTDGDGDFDEIYGIGGRSVTILDATTGALVAEIGKDLEERVIAAGKYDDTRSDNKGVEVETVVVVKLNGVNTAFISMERADMVAVYDLSNPSNPKFLQLFSTGDAPEGILYIKPEDSPNGRSLLIISSEGDGTVRFYQPDKL
jgi:hypothetical protein